MATITTWTKEAYQGEQLPAWSFTLKDKTGADITTYDAKIVFRNSPGFATNALVLLPGEGMIKTGATCTVDKKIADDMQPRGYVVELRAVLANGKVYKKEIGLFTVKKTITNA